MFSDNGGGEAVMVLIMSNEEYPIYRVHLNSKRGLQFC